MSSDDRRFVEVKDCPQPTKCKGWHPKSGAEPFSIDYEAGWVCDAGWNVSDCEMAGQDHWRKGDYRCGAIRFEGIEGGDVAED